MPSNNPALSAADATGAMPTPRELNWGHLRLGPREFKCYRIQAPGQRGDWAHFALGLTEWLAHHPQRWSQQPGFVIFHQGAYRPYLICGWWDQGNELFQAVLVWADGQWQEDSQRYSFCLYDLEIFWAERHFFLQAQTPTGWNAALYQQLFYQGSAQALSQLTRSGLQPSASQPLFFSSEES